jgi:hypothetical protein
VGNVHIPAGSFSGTETVKISCVSNNQILELDKLVKALTGNTNEVLGAVTLEPSPFTFNNDVTVIIPLLAQRLDLAGQYHKLYVYAPNLTGDLLPVSQALIAGDGWSGTANVDHFSIFVLVGPPASTGGTSGTTPLAYNVFITKVSKTDSGPGIASASDLYSPGIPTELIWEGDSSKTVTACDTDCKGTMDIPVNQTGKLIARNDSWGTCTVENVTLTPNDPRVFTVQWWQADQLLECSLR